MKQYLWLVLIISAISLTGCSTGETEVSQKPTVEKAWETPKSLKVPESVLYDADSQTIYVANINGSPTGKNGEGFIATLNLDGSVRELKWVTGMNAPKGMGISEGFLFVTDIDQVHAINIASGSISNTWQVDGAKFLNDIAVSTDGKVYITDMATKKIHVITHVEQTFITLDYDRPNGLLMSGNDLLVGTAQGLVKIDTESKSISLEIKNQGGIDGLKALGNGKYLVSDWAGKTQVIEKNKPPVVLIDTREQKINAADFEYIAEKKLILIPTFFDNRVMAYRLK